MLVLGRALGHFLCENFLAFILKLTKRNYVLRSPLSPDKWSFVIIEKLKSTYCTPLVQLTYLEGTH